MRPWPLPNGDWQSARHCDDWVGSSDDLWNDFWIDQSGPMVADVSMLKQLSVYYYSPTGAQGQRSSPILINGLPRGRRMEMMVENVHICVTDNEITVASSYLLHLMTNTRIATGLSWRTTSTHDQEVCPRSSVRWLKNHPQTHCHPPDYRGGTHFKGICWLAPMWSLGNGKSKHIETEMRRRDGSTYPRM